VPQPRDGPCPGVGEQPADPVAEPGAAQAGSARSGPVGEPGRAVLVVAVDPAAHGARVAAQQLGDGGRGPTLLGQQDHDQPHADPVGPCSSLSRSQGQPAGQERWRTRWRDAYWPGLVRSLQWQAPTAHEATSSATSPHPGLRTEPLLTRLALTRVPARGRDRRALRFAASRRR
jgi:hypothetical protein